MICKYCRLFWKPQKNKNGLSSSLEMQWNVFFCEIQLCLWARAHTHWPASHKNLMKWGCWSRPTEPSMAGRDWWKKIISVTGWNLHKPITVWSMVHFTFKKWQLFSESTGNGDWGLALCYSVSPAFFLPLSPHIAHTHTHKSPDGLLTTNKEQPHPDTASPMYTEIYTFLIIKLCHLNEQTPAKVLYWYILPLERWREGEGGRRKKEKEGEKGQKRSERNQKKGIKAKIRIIFCSCCPCNNT